MAGYNNNHLRFGERCRIQIFYGSWQGEGGPENMCYRWLEPFSWRWESDPPYTSRGTGLSEFKSPYEDPGPLPKGRPSHPLRFVVLVAGLPRVTGYSLKFAWLLLLWSSSALSVLSDFSKFTYDSFIHIAYESTRVTQTTTIVLKTRSPLLLPGCVRRYYPTQCELFVLFLVQAWVSYFKNF